MKKTLLLSIFLSILFIGQINAQLEIGLSGGVNSYSMFNIYSRHDGENLTNKRIGIPVKIKMAEHLRLKSGLFHNVKASELLGHETGNETIDRKYEIKYWEIDGQVEYFFQINRFEFAIYGGVSMGYAIKGKYINEEGERRLDFEKDGIRTQALDAVGGIYLGWELNDFIKIGIDGAPLKINMAPINTSGGVLEKRFVGGELLLSFIFVIE